MSAVFSILRLPAVLGLLLALLVCSGCVQATARQVAPGHASTVAQIADEQRADVIAEPQHAEPAAEQPATALRPLLFADDQPEPYRPRGPPGLTFLPMFPAPLILPLDVRMPGEVGVVVERVVHGQQVVTWAAISPVGWRVGAVRTVGVRYYNPVTGRYISRDPLGYADGMNPYLYVHNNPINSIDPLGLWEWGWSALRAVGNFTSGVADAITFGAVGKVQDAMGVGGSVDRTGGVYRAGGVAGDVIVTAASGGTAGGAKVLLKAGIEVAKGEARAMAVEGATQAAAATGLVSQETAEKIVQGVQLAKDGARAVKNAKKAEGEVGVAKGVQPEGGTVTTVDANGRTVPKVEHAQDFDVARREAFERAGMTDATKVTPTKFDPVTGTAVEFKGPGGAKVAYDAPHADMDATLGHDKPHVGWQAPGKRNSGGGGRGNITYDGEQHPSRPDNKEN